MSQAGEIDFVANNPDVPTTFIADVGSAVPIANTLEKLGTYVAAGSVPVETTGSGNTITIEVQTSQDIASTDVTKIGLAAFDSAAFTVDANGFVTLNGGGGGAMTDLAVDASTPPGTNPVVPSGGGSITLTGAQVSSGTIGANVIRTNSLAVNTATIEIQRSAAVAAPDSTKNGVSHFDSAAFAVDASGFVTLAGGGLAIDSIGTQTGTNPIVPTAGGLVTINGAVVAAGTNPVRSDGTGANTMALEVQISQAIASTDATKIGLASFDSNAFAVDANGFVTLAGGSLAIDSVAPNSGTNPIYPDGNGLLAIVGDGSITTVGTASTLTIQLTGLTNHAVLVGAGTTTITKVGPTATAGQVLQSAGASADPAFSTATYPATTSVSELLYSSSANVVSGLTTGLDGVLVTSHTGVPSWLANGTAGQVLTANTNLPPSWEDVGLFTWSVITGDQSAIAGNGYICNKAGLLTLTLPASGSIGDIIEVTGINTALGWSIAQNANQQIFFGTSSTTVGAGGSLASINIRDSVRIVCVVSGSSTVWNVISSVGNLTVT